MEKPRQYRFLKFMAVIYKVFAWLTLAAGLGVSIFAANLVSDQLGVGVPERINLYVFLGFFLPTLIGFGTLYAFSQGINLMLKIRARMTPEEKPARLKSVA